VNRENLTRMLIRHEGFRLKPYRCSAGRLTIGVGRNLDDVGVTEQEALSLLENDVDRVTSELDRYMPWWKNLDDARREALADMCFNLGLTGLMKFREMLAALEAGDYAKAAEEMLDSRWASQVGGRAGELAGIVRGGGASCSARS
jgi:lysozyme